jgi:glucokinase
MQNNQLSNVSVGVDIGGSHITCQLFDLDTKLLIGGTRISRQVDCHASAEEILVNWAGAIRKAAEKYSLANLKGIGFAMPGPFDYPGGVAWFNNVDKFENLYGVDIRKEIQVRLQLPDNYPVWFLNDAACFALGESHQGRAANHKRMLAVTLGTGFGTTFIDDHAPVAGKYGIPDDGFLYMVPFKDSVADEYFSTRWFLKEYQLLTGKTTKGVKELALLFASDEKVQSVFRTFGANLGTFLAPWLKSFEAGCLVIGGNISEAFPLFKTGLFSEFQKEGVKSEVLLSQLQEDAALYGSAGLCG